MSNSRRGRSINYKPRMNQMDAYDALPRELRDALKEGPQEWDTYKLLLQYRRMLKDYSEAQAIRSMLVKIEGWHRHEIRNTTIWPIPGWRVGMPKAGLSPHVMAKATMSRSTDRFPKPPR